MSITYIRQAAQKVFKLYLDRCWGLISQPYRSEWTRWQQVLQICGPTIELDYLENGRPWRGYQMLANIAFADDTATLSVHYDYKDRLDFSNGYIVEYQDPAYCKRLAKQIRKLLQTHALLCAAAHDDYIDFELACRRRGIVIITTADLPKDYKDYDSVPECYRPRR